MYTLVHYERLKFSKYILKDIDSTGRNFFWNCLRKDNVNNHN